jgi:hypothetical protein
LRQHVLASACARFFIHATQRRVFLFYRKPAQVHAGQLAGAVGMRQKNFPRILKGLHARIDRQTQQRSNFRFIQHRGAQPDMFLYHPPLRVNNECRRQRRNTAKPETLSFVAIAIG